MIKHIIFILIPFFISACGNHNTYFSQKLQNLEKIVNEHPQQVIDSLKSMPVRQLSKEEAAHYYLLQAIALDKNYENLSSDSTLWIANNYYTAQKDYYNLSRTQTYLAIYKACQENDRETAYKFLKEAQINYNKSAHSDSRILGVIFYWLGRIQDKLNNYAEAELYYNESIKAFKQINDTIPLFYSLKQLGLLYISSEKYKEADKIFQNTIEMLDSLPNRYNKHIIVLKANILNAKNFLYRRTSNIKEGLSAGKECIDILETNNIDIPSSYYYGIISLYNKLNKIDSCKFYCTKMLDNAEKEKNTVILIGAYKLLYEIEELEGNYEEACKLRNKYSQLKDEYSHKNKSESLLKLERRYTQSEKEKSILKEKNQILLVTIFCMVFMFIAMFLIAFLVWSRHKLKQKNKKLEKEIVKTRWGYDLSKELIADNSNSYIQLEHILMVNIQIIPSKVYDKIKQCIREEKTRYSNNIFSALSNIDKEFTQRIKKISPDLAPEDVLIASMIKHCWSISDITRVFRVSPDAIHKRRYRLKVKLLGQSADINDLDKYIRSI